MRIKFNDKIYRLKEIESGVDSLMELVEEPRYNDGDFVYEDGRIMIIKSYPNMFHALIYPYMDLDVVYNNTYAPETTLSYLNFRYATEEEKQLLIDAMKKDGKRWNADKKCIEDIPERKFKNGDKVRIKDGVSSKTHWSISPSFVNSMDKFIGKELKVEHCSKSGFVACDGYYFSEDWLEPWIDEPKNGDLAIFWDYDKGDAIIRLYDKKGHEYYYDSCGLYWENAIKFESKEQFEKILNGKV